MDIEFIEQEHRDNIFKIMELCNCEMAEAYQLYNNNGCNVENAVQAKFNPFGSQTSMNRHNQEPFRPTQPHRNNNKFNMGDNFGNFDPDIGQDEEYQSYKIFKESGMNFSKRYQVKKQNPGFKALFNYFKPSENNFKKKLQQYIGKRTNLSIPNGSLTESLQSIAKEKFPLLVHVLDFSKQPNIINNIRKIYTDQLLIEMFNIQFKSYGLNTKQYELQPCLKPFIDLKSDSNTLIIFRINIIEQIITVSKIPLATTTSEQVKKKLKQVKHNCINLEMEQSHHEKRYQNELVGIYDYQKPMSLAEQRKLKEDREIRRKQEEEFYASMQPKQQQSKTSGKNVSSVYSKPTQVKPQAPIIKKDLRAEALQQRKKIRDGLKIYESDGEGMIAIKLRVPSSELLKLYVHSNESAEYLYAYVMSRQNDLGFENDETRRVFDIIEPYDKINLSERKGQRLGKIFEGETMLSLVVNQKTD